MIRIGLLLLCLATQAGAQVFGSLVGTVRDESGAVIAGAQAIATWQQTDIAYAQISNSVGDYSCNKLPAGT
jgi:hypothetical protein